jgi:hypothetical protein
MSHFQTLSINQPSKQVFIYMFFKCSFKMNIFIQHSFETIWLIVKDADTSIVCTFWTTTNVFIPHVNNIQLKILEHLPCYLQQN